MLGLASARAEAGSPSTAVSLVRDAGSPPAAYAARKLGDALRERGYAVRDGGGAGFVVRLAVRAKGLPAEAFELTPSPRASALAMH